jgi:hypothetical protein
LFKVKGLYKFVAERADDLSIEENIIINVLRDEGEWLFGFQENDKRGYFPRNHVEILIEKKSIDEPKKVIVEEKNFICKALAIYDYQAQASDELTIKEGEYLKVISKDEDEWWISENDKEEKGLVPRTYLEEIFDTESDTGSPQNSKPQFPVTNPFSINNLNVNKLQNMKYGNDLLSDLPRSRSFGIGQGSRRNSGMAVVPESILQTWASTVDESIISKVSETERKRQEAIYELILTEANYVRDVQIIVEVSNFRELIILTKKNQGIL